MASSENVSSVHNNMTIYSATGSSLLLLGTSFYFMSYEYQDFDRVKLSDRSQMEVNRSKRKNKSKIIAMSAALMYIVGIILLVLSIGLYQDEKEESATSISAIIKQTRKTNNEPDTNEPVILASLAAVVIMLGIFQSVRNFNKTETFGWIGLSLFSIGWISSAFAASMQNNAISSIYGERLAWTLPGAVAIVVGTAALPWQIKHQYVSGPALSISAIGYALFTIGNVFVVKPSS
jgi:uncharacterized membrane protein HdeD (DUF308 family)